MLKVIQAPEFSHQASYLRSNSHEYYAFPQVRADRRPYD